MDNSFVSQVSQNIRTYKNKTSFFYRLKDQKYLQAMALPSVLWMIIFCYIPMIGILIAFMDYDIIRPFWSNSWVGIDNFKEFFIDDYFWQVIKNTVGISFLKLLINFPAPIVFAIMLNELNSIKFKRIVQTVSYLPHFISWVILGGIMMVWFSDTGFITNILSLTGISQERIDFLADPKYFWSVAVVSDLWKEVGWGAIIYLAAISGIDQEMYEAAKVDGAGKFRRIWSITLPCLKPTIAILFVLSCCNLMSSNFDQVFVLKNQLNLDASNVIDIYIYQMGLQSSRFSFATAVGLFKSVVNLALLLMANYMSKKLTETSLV